VRSKIKFIIAIFTLTIILSPNISKADLNNKIIISVGSEIITNYDLSREFKYLNVITVGKFKSLNPQENRKIAIDSLIKDKIKSNVLSTYKNVRINDEMLANQIVNTIRSIGFRSIEDFKKYLEYEGYKFEEFEKKVMLEMKWNQLIYQFYKNQIVVDKEKIDKKLKDIISNQETVNEYLVHEIFVENSKIRKKDNKTEEILTEIEKNEDTSAKYTVLVEEKDGIIIEAESATYGGKKTIKKSEEKNKKIENAAKTEINDQISIKEIIKKIEKEGFEDTAILYSSSPTAKLGGKLGWVNEKKFSKLLLEFIKKTKVGSITEPIPITEGMLILKIADKRALENKIDLEKKMNELIEIEKNKQLDNFSTNYFNQVKNSIKIKYFDE
tara:strand:+ start:2226 stop:3377 length:1152 start_codon:yes stop_codon:yes gene_type:complete